MPSSTQELDPFHEGRFFGKMIELDENISALTIGGISMIQPSLNGFCGPHPEGEGPISGKHHLKRNRSVCTQDLSNHHNPD